MEHMMIIPPGILSLKQVYDLADDPRYLDLGHPEREPYAPIVDRLFEGHLSPKSLAPARSIHAGTPARIGGSVGANGENRPQDVADVEESLLPANGLGYNQLLQRTRMPTPELAAAILGFQNTQRLEADGLVLPNGPNTRGPNPTVSPADVLRGRRAQPGSLRRGRTWAPHHRRRPGRSPAHRRSGTEKVELFPERRHGYAKEIEDNLTRLLAPDGNEIPADTLDDFEPMTLVHESDAPL
jgi:hypothetical protein